MIKRSIPKVRISIPFVLISAVLYIGDLKKAFLPTVIAMCLHELGHIIAIKLCGGTIEKIDIKIFGAQIFVPELALMPYKSEIIIAAAGPAAGILTSVCVMSAAYVLNTQVLSYFIGINFVISAVNLIPVYPLDGGRIAFSALRIFLPIRSANITFCLVSVIASQALLALCVVLTVNNALNPTIIIFAAYVAVCAVMFRPRI